VSHLLTGNFEDVPFPGANPFRLRPGDPVGGVLLHRKGGEEVLAEQPVLQLGRLGQIVDQFLARIDHASPPWVAGQSRALS
jgi:hypothetical protein